jgi:hypothetical protein
MKAIKYTKALLTLILLAFSLGLSSQNNNLDQKPWSFNLNFGQTLFWGDGNNDILNPFNAYFQNDKSAFGYGIIIQKNLNPWLGFDFQYIGGQLKGTRYTWSDETPADLYFLSKINHLGLNLDIDILDIFREPQTTRLFNFYIRGGGAYNFFNATEYNLTNDAVVANIKDGGLEVNGGWGIRFDLSKEIGLTFENIFTYSFSDLLDAHSSQFSQANDIFAYTSLGFTYRVYPQPKKPRLETDEENQPIDLSQSETKEEIKQKPELKVKIYMPQSIKANDTISIKVSIAKYDLKEAAKLQQTLPIGFYAIANKSETASFNFSDQITSFTWEKFPADQEQVEVSYYLISKNVEAGNYNIPGILFFTENGKETIAQFKESIDVVIPEPSVIAVNNKTIEEPAKEIIKEEAIEQAKTTNIVSEQGPIEGLEYRVQIKAIYGGKSSPESIAREYKIQQQVTEEFTNGYSKYTVGHFATYAEAKAYRDEVRSGKVPGAFVVAYYNGKRTDNINDAIKMEGTKVESTQSIAPTIKVEGISYSIQIAASNRELSANSIQNQFGLDQKVIMTTHNGLYKYLIGSYESYDDAIKTLNLVKGKVSDAFIVKFTNGLR